MRTTYRRQLSLPVPSVPHKHSRMLASMAAILDAMPELEESVLSDLTADGARSDFGRDGLSAQQVLRLMVLYTMLRTTFEQIEFHLADSPTYRSFPTRNFSQLAALWLCEKNPVDFIWSKLKSPWWAKVQEFYAAKKLDITDLVRFGSSLREIAKS